MMFTDAHHDVRSLPVRTTINLADDVAAAVEKLRRQRRIGLSDAVNELLRAGLASERPTRRYKHKSFPMGLQIDVANVGEVLDLIDQWDIDTTRPPR